MITIEHQQHVSGTEKSHDVLTAFCATCPDPHEVSHVLQAFGFRLVFSLPADTTCKAMADLPPLPAQYHYEDEMGTSIAYLAGVDAPCLDDDEHDTRTPHRFPRHASRFWLTEGSQQLVTRRVRDAMAAQWALSWQALHLMEDLAEAV